MGSKHIKNFEEKFIERGLTPLEEIRDAKHKIMCVDAEGYKYLLCYRGSVSDKRTKRFDRWDKTNPFVDGQQHFYAGGWTDDDKLRYNQELDKIKEDYCSANGHTLIRIPYWLYRHSTYKDILNQTFFG